MEILTNIQGRSEWHHVIRVGVDSNGFWQEFHVVIDGAIVKVPYYRVITFCRRWDRLHIVRLYILIDYEKGT